MKTSGYNTKRQSIGLRIDLLNYCPYSFIFSIRDYVFFKTALEKEWHLAVAAGSHFFPAYCYCQLLLVLTMKKHLPKDRQSFVDVQFLSA
jgi:hypothetical protein